MARSVTDEDVRALVQLVEDGRRAAEGTDLPATVVEALVALVPCDDVTFLELAPADCGIPHMQGWPTPEEEEVVGDGVADDPFWTHYWDCDAVSYPTLSGDTRSVTTISDFYSQRQWRSTGMYADVLSGIEHRIMVCLAAPAGRERRLLLFRSSGPDFDERDRLLLWLVRPHLDELYQEMHRRSLPVPALTARQHEILTFVARGLSNKEIAAELGLSAATVRTHLERVFRQLGVTTRTGAVAKAFPTSPH
jgi:DNA-binding CsgD family transcriptional regulator